MTSSAFMNTMAFKSNWFVYFWATFGQTWATFGQTWPTFGKTLAIFGQLLYKLELLFILTSGHTEPFLFSRLLSNLSVLVVISHLLARVLKREKYNRETRMIKRISNDWAFLFFFKYLIFIHIKVSCKSLIYNSFYQLTELLCGV